MNISLTKRELQILYLICDGKSTKEISYKLFISTSTVESHRSNLLSKLDAINAPNLIVKAYKKGILTL